uniref:site-specific integrase n=1 Tax=uncultured Bacteroides sp. TaxID=162156 RepID=UPI00280AA914|nr:site-specific integrase [uncultured Bacteroides sp.]
MYKYSKDGVSVLTVLDKRKPKKNGLFPIKVQVIYNRKQKYYSSGQSVSIKDWERLPNAKSRQLSEIRRNIENSFSLIKRQVEILSFQGEFHFDTLNARLGKYSELSLNTLFKRKLEELKDNGQANTYLSYKGALNKIEQFAGKHISFHEITVNWLNRFERHLSASGISYSSMGFHFRNLKCILNIARKDGVIKESQYPFGKGKYEIPVGYGRKMALNLEEIKKIVTYTDGTKKTEMYRDLWFFSYLCNGINFRDLLYLQYSNIINEEICFIRAKTARNTKQSKIIHAVITPEMHRIIEKWGNTPTSPETYIFPFATGTENPFEKVKLVREVVTECNQILYRISCKTGIPRITTYSARHSFATVLKRSGVNIAYISESLGHSNLAITENYLASFEAEERKKNSVLLTQFDI